ncbi:MAG: hypothetical protein KME12_18295 [Trichocoleus desertorum ATA4-8-CV12]|jgi:hypothetical protein|nr:hypothetical protein [Trichocoleus desertorum ATA4-8-CV12]
MGAYSTYQNTDGFILTEERIQKIHEILTNRGQAINHDCKPKYRVFRSDSFVFDTNDIQVILSEGNSKTQRIEAIQIEMSFEKELSLSLTFSSITQLTIGGENRDFVFLIFSDLDRYLRNEVNAVGISNLQRIFSTRNFAIFFVSVLVAWTATLPSLQVHRVEQYQKQYDKSLAQWETERDKKVQEEIAKTNKAANQALSTKNTNEKLDFLIRERIHTPQSSISTYPDYKYPKGTFFEQPYFLYVLILAMLLPYGLVRLMMSKLYEKDLF